MKSQVGLIALVALLANAAMGQQVFDPGRASFSVAVNNEIYPYREFSTSVLPRERIVLRILDQGESDFTIRAGEGQLEQTDGKRWIWHAPKASGPTEIKVSRVADDQSVTLHVFVMVSSAQLRKGVLLGYRVGDYPPAVRDVPIYDRPSGFIRVRQQDLGIRVSPHFVLGQFVSDRTEQFPKYVVLRERLLLKLEALLERINQRGHEAQSFRILSGYRTPVMNAQVGGAQYSRHMYGGAASIIVDANPADGLMDDLNADGIGDLRDVQILFALADALTREPDNRHLQGGLALYRANERRGPYLQVDARGFRARWRADLDKQRSPQPVKPLTTTR